MSPLLTARAATKSYRTVSLVGRSPAKTVLSAATVTLSEGETVALLGRSGSGKSTLARLLLGLEKPDHGEIAFRGRPLGGFSRADWRAFRGAVQMVFQDSLGAVNPRHRVGRIIGEPLRHLTTLDDAGRAARRDALLCQVGLTPEDADKLPQQMSGGQLQRVCIARALAPGPRLLVLDEAVSNLDLMLQIQMIDLLKDLQRQTGMAYLFVTHDLRLVERFCQRVIVLDEGKIVEEAPVTGAQRFEHPASRALQRAILPVRPTAALVGEGGRRRSATG
ncbi:nickel import ATP-binding protein NikE [Rhodospirillum rubrum]|uniref:nickel import ATP-binding protein NikE n=2 Tax=Rhodospirillum rubrum TaxID=1085 RepID=UPI0019087E73|nr:nickel import ATP-binding protein NikE [Rhodospirillum rubrum]MBK1677158.1 nickel import ATP-binding protein NikE [Rhodospirillum rubrum]